MKQMLTQYPLKALWFITTTLLLTSNQLTYAQTDAQTDAVRVVDNQIIRVSATGTAYGEPDIATVRLGVSLTGDPLETLLARANTTAEAITDALNTAGVDRSDIRTSAFHIFEEQTFNPMTGEAEPAGYRVTHVYGVTVRNIATLGSVLSEALAAGANRVQDVQYSVSEPSTLERLAREQAVDAARAKAQHLADLAGVTLAGVMTIQETSSPSSNTPVNFNMMDMAVAEEAMNVPTASGQLAIHVRVDITFALTE
jgi:uncharacterized protein YggE